MKISEQEIEAIPRLEPIERYRYVIKRVADTEIMYTLVDNEGNWAIANVENNPVFSLWSAAEFARACAVDEWSSYRVKEITLEEFEDSVIDLIAENNYLINVFSIQGKSGFVVELTEFARDLSEALEKYH